MITTSFVTSAREASRRRRSRILEFRAFCSGAALVLTGLLLAALYCLATHHLTA
jgi:hypothetical protein